MGEGKVMSDCILMICKGTGARWERGKSCLTVFE